MQEPNKPLSLNSHGERMQARLTHLSYTIPEDEVHETRFGPGTEEALRQFQRAQGLPETGMLDEASQAALAEAAEHAVRTPNSLASSLARRSPEARVSGRVFFEYDLPAAHLELRLYVHGPGGKAACLAQCQTGPDGRYEMVYHPEGRQINLEVRVVSGDQEISLSKTQVNAGKREVLNLVAPGSLRPLEPEYQRLVASLRERGLEPEALAQLQENGDQPDLSMLRQSTGWDARLIALAALASRLNAQQSSLPAEFLYGLFRAGLPTDPQQLAAIDPEAAASAAQKARDAGIISLTD